MDFKAFLLLCALHLSAAFTVNNEANKRLDSNGWFSTSLTIKLIFLKIKVRTTIKSNQLAMGCV